MDQFKLKYPAFTALLFLVASLCQDFAAQGQTWLQKLESTYNLFPQIISFIKVAPGIAAEAIALGGSPTDIEAGAELLVTDLAFTSDKAKAIITAAFPLCEKLTGSIGDIQNLIAAFKA